MVENGVMMAEAMVDQPPMQLEREESGSRDLVLLAAIRAVRAGDSEAFETVMQRSERRVATLAWRILADPEDVREAIQETYLRVFRHLDRYDERREFIGWLYTIAVNVCRDIDRKRRRRAARYESLDDVHPVPEREHPDRVAARSQEVMLLERAVDALPPKQRLAVILRDIEELPTDEVAEILGTKPVTVRVQISAARAKIRELFEAWRRGVES